VQTLSVKRFPDRLGFGLAARFLGDPLSGTRGVRHNLLITLNLHFPESEATRVQLTAQSGAGKSFLTNELLATNLSVGGRCWVIDVGRSYENLCASLRGQFVAFTREATLCLNPFELVRNWEEEADVITALVTAMAAPTEPLGDYRTAGLKRALKALWDSKATAMTVDDVAAALMADKDQRIRDVGQQLYPFTRAGKYGRFFNGANTVTFAADFVVLELEELKGRKYLQQVVLLQLIYQIQQVMYLGDRAQPVQAIDQL
jgi:conjugal transfer ATP-binding protein TraC